MRAVSPSLGSCSPIICPHTVQVGLFRGYFTFTVQVLFYTEDRGIKLLRNSATLHQTTQRNLPEDMNVL
jgi:hypothetical protein